MKKTIIQRGSAAALLIIAIAVFTVTAISVNIYRSAHEDTRQAQIDARVKNLDARVEIAMQAMQQLRVGQDALGATNKIPDIKALYEDSLASKITSSATSFTLTRGTSNGTALASSTYPFIIDEGTSNEEFVLADCTGTTCTNVTRGLSLTTGTTTVASLQKAHGRGASVKITDGPILLILNRILQGVDTFPNLLAYESGTACDSSSPGGTICDATFVRTLSGQGAATSSESVGGIAELATKLEQASSTDFGADRPLVLQAKYATSSPDGSPAGLFALILDNAGKIAHNAFDLTRHFSFSSLFATNASSTNATTTNAWVTALGTAAGTIVGADPTGKLIATSTPPGAYVGTAVATTTAVAADTTQDNVFTTGWAPSLIRVNYRVYGKTSTAVQYGQGWVEYPGSTTATANYQLNKCPNSGANSTIDSTTFTLDATDPACGRGDSRSANGVFAGLTVTSVTATGFTVRTTFTSGGGESGGGASYYVTAYR